MKKITMSLGAAILLCSYFFNAPTDQIKITKESHEHEQEGFDYMQFMSAMNIGVNHEIPVDGYVKAWNFASEKKLNETPVSGTSWQNIGPDNKGGRTIGLAIDPNDTSIVWLGSAGGGLWKSTTGGIGDNAWTYVPTGFPVEGVSTIAIEPDNSNTIYIGTGETYDYGHSENGLVDRPTRGSYGIGILKSTDDGVTWTKSLDWSLNENRGIWKVLFNPKNYNTVYAATTEGVYKSVDAGASWSQVLAEQMVMDMLIDPNDSNTLYAGVGNLFSANKGIYRTQDAGQTWQLLTNGIPDYSETGRITLAFNPFNSKHILAFIADKDSVHAMYKTFNGGDSWSALNWGNNTDNNINSYQGWYAKGLTYKPNDTTLVFASGVYLSESTTGGTAFAFNFDNGNYHSDIHDVQFNPLDPDKTYVITDAGLFRSNQFDRNFFSCYGGYATMQFYIGAVAAHTPQRILAGAQDNFVAYYNGANNWEGVIGGDGCYAFYNPDNDNIAYSSIDYNNIYKSTNGGTDYNIQMLPAQNSDIFFGEPVAFVAPFILSPSDPTILYAATNRIFRSANQNFFFSVGPALIDSGAIVLSLGINPQNANVLYAGTAPDDSGRHMDIFKTTDGGNTFSKMTSSVLPNRYPRAIKVDPTDTNIVYIVFAGFGGGHVFKSEDGGLNWADISAALPDIPFHSLLVDPQNHNWIFAGSEFGIFLSEDGGQTWNDFNSGMPDAAEIFDLQYSPSDQLLYAFTHGHGTYTYSLLTLAVTSPSGNALQFSVSPSPARNKVILKFDSKIAGDAAIRVVNMDGKPVQEMQSGVHNGLNLVSLSLQSLARGEYLVSLQIAGTVAVQKLILQ